MPSDSIFGFGLPATALRQKVYDENSIIDNLPENIADTLGFRSFLLPRVNLEILDMWGRDSCQPKLQNSNDNCGPAKALPNHELRSAHVPHPTDSTASRIGRSYYDFMVPRYYKGGDCYLPMDPLAGGYSNYSSFEEIFDDLTSSSTASSYSNIEGIVQSYPENFDQQEKYRNWALFANTDPAFQQYYKTRIIPGFSLSNDIKHGEYKSLDKLTQWSCQKTLYDQNNNYKYFSESQKESIYNITFDNLNIYEPQYAFFEDNFEHLGKLGNFFGKVNETCGVQLCDGKFVDNSTSFCDYFSVESNNFIESGGDRLRFLGIFTIFATILALNF